MKKFAFEVLQEVFVLCLGCDCFRCQGHGKTSTILFYQKFFTRLKTDFFFFNIEMPFRNPNVYTNELRDHIRPRFMFFYRVV